MRVWDVPPGELCDRHLLGEHSEIHALWSILTKGKKGFSKHPETLRWKGKTSALYNRHEAVAREMTSRGFRHASDLDPSLATGKAYQDSYVDTPERQRSILAGRDCDCYRNRG